MAVMIVKTLKVAGVGTVYALTIGGFVLLVVGGIQNPGLVFRGFMIALVLIVAIFAAAILLRKLTAIED